MASIRDQNELIARRALDVMGNSTYQPVGGEPSGDAGAQPTLVFPQHIDGTTVVPWRVGIDPVNDDHFFILPD